MSKAAVFVGLVWALPLADLRVDVRRGFLRPSPPSPQPLLSSPPSGGGRFRCFPQQLRGYRPMGPMRGRARDGATFVAALAAFGIGVADPAPWLVLEEPIAVSRKNLQGRTINKPRRLRGRPLDPASATDVILDDRTQRLGERRDRVAHRW